MRIALRPDCQTAFLRYAATLLVVTGGACSPPPSLPAVQSVLSRPVLIARSSLDLGPIVAGRAATSCLLITNPSSHNQGIARFEVSCPYVAIQPLSLAIPAGGQAVATLTFDSSKEPEFRGELAIRVDAFADDTRPLFGTTVLVSVIPSIP